MGMATPHNYICAKCGKLTGWHNEVAVDGWPYHPECAPTRLQQLRVKFSNWRRGFGWTA